MGGMKRTIEDGLPRMICEDALDDFGYILTRKDAATSGNCSKVDAQSEPPIGVNEYDTKNRVTDVATADQYLNVLNDGFAMVKVTAHANRGNDIAIGDWLESYSDGMAMYLAAEGALAEADMPKTIGRAWEAIGSGVNPGGVEGGKILVELKPQYC